MDILASIASLQVYEGNNWASLKQTEAGDWETDPVVFRALCWGSHISFAFDYGDGYEEVIEGQLGLFSNYYGLGTHVYTEGRLSCHLSSPCPFPSIESANSLNF